MEGFAWVGLYWIGPDRRQRFKVSDLAVNGEA